MSLSSKKKKVVKKNIVKPVERVLVPMRHNNGSITNVQIQDVEELKKHGWNKL